MGTDDSELLAEFVVESQEHLGDVETQLLTLESQGDAMDVALVNTVFRAVHSIKGAAGFLGLETLQGVAHRAEEILNKLRNRELSPTSLVINTLLKATDCLKDLLSSIENSNNQDTSALLHELELILSGDTPAAVPASDDSKGSKSDNGLSNEALREFLVESYDNIDQLERDLLALESDPTSESLVNGVFRSIHTIKGTAGFLGFGKLERITHVAENMLGDVRAGSLTMCPEIGSGLFSAIDAVKELLQAIENTGTEGDCDCESLAGALATLHQILMPFDVPSVEKRPKAKPENSPTAKKTPAAKTASKSSPPAKKARPAKAVKTTSSKVSLLASSNTTTALDANFDNAVLEVSSTFVEEPAVSQIAQATPAISTAMLETSSQNATLAPSSAPRSANAKTAEVSAADSSIRVDVALLDKLMTCVGELVLARNQILQFSSCSVESELHRTSQRLNLITSELQESVMKTRMQPIGNVWSKFPRLVRDLATICEKQVRIEMEGKETELDKTIIEAIKDPLTHLVRNTVDHGIERPEVRVANGKDAEGCLTLRAYHEGGRVNIEICDDGAGINIERVKNKALERGLMTQEQVARLSDRDAGNLIFLPGFSTAEKVSNVSGRGVGMDVVKTNIEKIGGTVDLQSQPGSGTVIRIKIPLTLAIIPALIVTCDENRYAIPQVNLLELVRLDGEQMRTGIEWIQSAPVYRLRGQLLPLVYLRDQLKIENKANSDALNIVVLRADDRQFGLVVDRINDSEEIVVKPLSKQLKNVPVYSGTTIMGDGRVALILDVLGLAHASSVISAGADRRVNESSDKSINIAEDRQTLLVVGVGANHRFAVPISQVTRLEKLEASKLEYAESQEVIQYRGEILPLLRMIDVLGCAPAHESDSDMLEVLVYIEQGRSVGIIVDKIIDIVQARLDKEAKSHTVGIVTSTVLQNHVTDVVDLPAILRQFDPDGSRFRLVN